VLSLSNEDVHFFRDFFKLRFHKILETGLEVTQALLVTQRVLPDTGLNMV
jgi:hypothetical protein